MILTYDVGSIPFFGDFEKFSNGSKVNSIFNLLDNLGNYSNDRKYFEKKVVDCFIDKIKTGLSIPNYPQFRDMSEMFLNQIEGVEKVAEGYRAFDKISCINKKLEIPEMNVIKENSREISEIIGKPSHVKMCVTGPYTLASMFINRQIHLLRQLGDVISKIIERNVFFGKFGQVVLISVDEPFFGLTDDPLLDYGSTGREELLMVWETIFHKIKSMNIKSIIHLHSTTNELFWNIKSLDIIESHVNDSLYSSIRTKEHLKERDKLLKATIGVTDFDSLIRTHELSRETIDEITLNQRIGDIWKQIKNGGIDPVIFLEDKHLIYNRLKRIVDRYGERVSYAGPECGLTSFPNYNCALENLRRISQVVNQINMQLKND